MSSTTTLRSDVARTGTNPNFPINANPWRKYLSVNLGVPVRAGVLVVENWLFNAGPFAGQTRTLILVATCSNEVYCYSEGDLLANPTNPTPLWHTPLGVAPVTLGGSNIPPPIGVCGTPVVDTAGRRMFVVAMWSNGGPGEYSIFNLSLDTGNITAQQQLVDPGPSAGAAARVTFVAAVVDQRTAINLVGDWLWLGFAAFMAYDEGPYYGWVVAINPNNLAQQLYQPSISLNSSVNYGIYAGGVWGPGGVAAAPDGSVYALTGNATQLATKSPSATAGADDDLAGNAVFGNYWAHVPAAGPGSLGDFFNALVRLAVTGTGASAQITVKDWFQCNDAQWYQNQTSQSFTQFENGADFDFGGSSPVVLPVINGKQLVAFVPKDGNVFVVESDAQQGLGHYGTPLMLQPFADALNANPGGNDTKAAIAFLQTPDQRNILVVGADSNVTTNQGTVGGVAVFELVPSGTGTATTFTLQKLWVSPHFLGDSFGSPTIIANPVPDPANPPSPIGLAWVVDGGVGGNTFVMRAYDVLTGAIVYDSALNNDTIEPLPHFPPMTSGGNSFFCGTNTGFIGFTQFVAIPKSLSFIMERSTFGMSEIDADEPTTTSVASINPAYWVVLNGFLPSDLGLTPGNLNAPPQKPQVTPVFDPTLAATLGANGLADLKNMLNAGLFSQPVVPENPLMPDEPQGFLFPFAVTFAGDQGFRDMAQAMPPLPSTLVTLDGSLPGTTLTSSVQIELVTGEDPFFDNINTNPQDAAQFPTWLSFDLRFFKMTVPTNGQNPSLFGVPMTTNPADAPGFIANVLPKMTNAYFNGLHQDEDSTALEFKQTDDQGNYVFNFAVARVRLKGSTAGPLTLPVRVFFRLFQAQNTVSNFDPDTTYRLASNGVAVPTGGNPVVGGLDIPLLGVQNDQTGSPEYVTIPCFATARCNLSGPVAMTAQHDKPNAQTITVIPDTEVDTFFGCWVDINQPAQAFLPPTPPAGNYDGPWTNEWNELNHGNKTALQSVNQAITAAPHQCLIAEIRYDDAPIIPNANSGTSDKLAQRNIAWIDGPNPGLVASRRMTHPIQVRPTPRGALSPDELMIFWGRTPVASEAQLYLPALSAAEICALATRRYPGQEIWIVDEHTVGFGGRGVTFVPLPAGVALAAGLLTVTLPPGIRKGDEYLITVRQLTAVYEAVKRVQPAPVIEVAAEVGRLPRTATPLAPAAVLTDANLRSWRRVEGAFQVRINISTKEALLLKEERLLAIMRSIALNMPVQKRWYPVLQRYIDYIAGRVQGFGGVPAKILPSPTGWVPGMPVPPTSPPTGHHPHRDGSEEFTGKIEGLSFDHFGDFEGFVLATETGAHERFFNRERAMHDLVQRAWLERCRVTVMIDHRHRGILRVTLW